MTKSEKYAMFMMLSVVGMNTSPGQFASITWAIAAVGGLIASIFYAVKGE